MSRHFILYNFSVDSMNEIDQLFTNILDFLTETAVVRDFCTILYIFRCLSISFLRHPVVRALNEVFEVKSYLR